MFRIFLIIIALLAALPAAANQSTERIAAARTYLNSGNPDQAIITAQRALKKGGLKASDRQALLALVARAKTMRTTHQHFHRVEAAIQAIDAVIHEFPDSPGAAQFRWDRAWLWWKAGSNKQAISAVRDIISQDQQPSQLRRAWLLMTRIHIRLQNYAYARSDLLQYGLQVELRSREQATGMAWMATVDQAESRQDMAFKNLNAVYRAWPDVITSEPELFSLYIHLLYEQGNNKDALQLANAFTKLYISGPHAAPVRLIRANIHATAQHSIADAIKEYAILADSQAETSIGRKAFMRKLMLEFRHAQDRETLLPVMIALKKIAVTNQLSSIEDEAMLDLARLWARIRSAPEPAPKSDPKPAASDKVAEGNADRAKKSQGAPALQAYARAATSLHKRIADAAMREGSAWLTTSTQSLLEKKQWLQAVTVWRQYPQLRPASNSSQTLRLGIAEAMRMLMLFDAADDILKKLYAQNSLNIRGQRIMMERARLWMDRHDADGVQKIMHWLNRHEFSMYRPEMLLIVARIQMAGQQAEMARQTLMSVRVSDLAIESRSAYWETKADISERLSEWHRAASAWGQYRKIAGADSKQGLLNQASNLFIAKEFAQARKLYQLIPEDEHDAHWQYQMGVCDLRTGATKQGLERLQKLIDGAQDSRFVALAKLALADQQAEKLLGEKP